MINLFNRLLALILSAALMVGGGLALAGVSGGLTPEVLQTAPGLRPVAELMGRLEGAVMLQAAIGGACALLVGLALFALEVRGPKRVREVLVHRDKLGALSVSLSGLRRLADHVVGSIAGVDTVVSDVRPTRDGVAFVLHVQVHPTTSTPELAEQIRTDLAEAVRHHIGQAATRVDIRTEVPALASGRAPGGKKVR